MGGSARARAYYGALFESRRASVRLRPSLKVEFTDARVKTAASSVLDNIDERFCEEVRMIAAFLDCCWFDRPPSERELRKLLRKARDSVRLLRQQLTSVRPLIEPQLGEVVERRNPSAFGPAAKILELDEPIYPLLRALKAVEGRLERRLDLKPTGGAPVLPKQAAIWALRDLILEYKGACSQQDLFAIAKAFLEPVLAHHGDLTDLRHHVRQVIEIADGPRKKPPS